MARKGDGSTGYVLNSTGVPVPTSYSYSLWMRGVAAPGTAIISKVMTLTGAGSTVDCGFSWDHTDPTYEQAAYHTPSGSGAVAAKLVTALKKDVWYHLVATWDGSNVRAYLNGSLEATTAATTIQGGANGQPSVLAKGVAGAEYWNGAVDEFAYWQNKVLTQAQISALYAGVPPPAVRAFGANGLDWRLGTASPETDFSGNSLTGAITGTTVIVTGTPLLGQQVGGPPPLVRV